MVQFSTRRLRPARNLIPLSPVQAPLIEILRRITMESTPALTMTPLTPAARMPASVPSPLIVMDLVMVTAPNPPGSSTEISPHVAVFDIAPAKVLHGAVRLHGLASSPTPDTHVLVACACAIELQNKQITHTASKLIVNLIDFITISFDFPIRS